MPIKRATLTDAERAKRIREAAREIETDNDPASFERAFAVVAKAKPEKSEGGKKSGSVTDQPPL
jgi:hypothetical protein